MNEWEPLSESLVGALQLERKPVAVCLTDEIPAGVPATTGPSPAGCVFWEQAEHGAFVTGTTDHELCAIGVHTHNLAEPSASYESELGGVLKVMADMEYVRDEDVAAIPVLEKQSRHVVYAPLGDSPLPPDVVLLFADAAQGLTIAEAVQQVESDLPPALGRPACAVVPQAINSQRAAVSLGCCGARAYLDALSDGVALWALPGARLAEYVARIEKLAAANRTLGKFHELRRRDVEDGKRPTYSDSLARLGS